MKMTRDKKSQHKTDSLKDKLLVAGTEYLKDHAPEELTMRKLASLCDVTPHAIYNHFKDKEDFFNELNNGFTGGLTQFSIGTVLDPSIDMHEKMFRFGKAYLLLLYKYPYYLRMISAVKSRPYYTFDFTGEKVTTTAKYSGWPRISPAREDDGDVGATYEHVALLSLFNGLSGTMRVLNPATPDECDKITRQTIDYYLTRIGL